MIWHGFGTEKASRHDCLGLIVVFIVELTQMSADAGAKPVECCPGLALPDVAVVAQECCATGQRMEGNTGKPNE